MTNEQLAALSIGDLVRHTKSGKLYKLTNVIQAQPAKVLLNWNSITGLYDIVLKGDEAIAYKKANNLSDRYFIVAQPIRYRFTMWQVNEKFPSGRYYQAAKTFTADKVQKVER